MKKTLAIFICICMMFGLVACTGKEDTKPNNGEGSGSSAEITKAPDNDNNTPTAEPTEEGAVKVEISTEMRDMTTQEIVRDMGMGINLGNTYEACGDWIGGNDITKYITAWGSPLIGEATIKGYADAGFGVIRVPVAWSNLIGDDYTINAELMSMVKETVELILAYDMYCILNIHYDNGWWEDFPTDKEECMHHYTRIWEQLVKEFGSYGDKLMFESLNEEGGWNSVWNQWSGSTNGKDVSYGLLNEINQTFVNIVRESGGNNATRHLLIAGYNTDVDLTCDSYFKMPEDPANHCAVSVHYYTPSTFAILDKDADWGKAKTEWGNDADVKELNGKMDLLVKTFVDKGVPVIVGEYACAAKKNKTKEMINLFDLSVCEAIYSRNMCPVLWDVQGDYYTRVNPKLTKSKPTWNDPEFIKNMMAIKDKYK